MKALLLIIVFILVLYYFYIYFKEINLKKDYLSRPHDFALIVYSDGDKTLLPKGKWYINQDIIYSSKEIWCLPWNKGDLKSIAEYPENMRHLTHWKKHKGNIPLYNYYRFFIEV